MTHAKDAMWQADGYVELASAVGDRRDPRLAARAGPGDPGEPGVRGRPAGRPPQPGQRPDAAEAQPLRARRDPHPGRHRGGRPRGDARHPPHRLGAHRPLPPAERQRPAAARRVRRGRPARRRGGGGPDDRRPSAGRGPPARASPRRPTSPTCWRSRPASTTARRTTSWGGRCATSSTPASRRTRSRRSGSRRPREATIGRPVAIAAEVLAAALDPAACAAARLQTGSSAPGEVAAMIAGCRARDRRGAGAQRGGAGAGGAGRRGPAGRGRGSWRRADDLGAHPQRVAPEQAQQGGAGRRARARRCRRACARSNGEAAAVPSSVSEAQLSSGPKEARNQTFIAQPKRMPHAKPTAASPQRCAADRAQRGPGEPGERPRAPSGAASTGPGPGSCSTGGRRSAPRPARRAARGRRRSRGR